MSQSDAAYAEDLQLQEALQLSLMLSSQIKKDDPSSSSSSSSSPQAKSPFFPMNEGLIFEKSIEPVAWEEAISEVIEKSECPICHELFCNKCSVPPDSAVEEEKHQLMNEGENTEKFTVDTGKKPVLCFLDEDDDHDIDNSDDHDSDSSPGRLKSTSKTLVVPTKMLPKWKGLEGENQDHEIVWPPMVIIRNTSVRVENKYIGMGNQELLEKFSSYSAIKVEHFYGPQGHRGWSLLIFDNSVHGYLEAERLHKTFFMQGLGKNARIARPNAFALEDGGDNQLYGYLAGKGDMDFLNNKICHGNLRLKYEIKSYKDMVNEVGKLCEDNKQVAKVKQMFVEEKMRADALDESIRSLREKLDRQMEEAYKLRQKFRTQDQHKEEVEFQENFFKDQIRNLELKDTEEEDQEDSTEWGAE